MHPDQEKLNKAGYITKRFTEYHFQVKKSGGKDIVNVWPTAGKILMKYTPGPAKFYDDIVSAVKDLLDPTPLTRAQLKEQLYRMYPLPKPVPAFDYWQEHAAILIKHPALLKEYVQSI